MDWRARSVLVTGGTGSFGQKLVELMLARHPPWRLVVYSRDEFKQAEMARRYPHAGLRFFLGDVRDRTRLARALSGVEVVFHAAALKQVPACEYNPFEAVQTNVLGTQNVIDAAIDAGVWRLIGLSTDKAVSPLNLYGATKLCAEKLLVQGNTYGQPRGTAIGIVRYGNVLGSRGSVVQAFLEQRQSGRLALTHMEMTRFALTLEHGVAFAIKCAERLSAGETYVPKLPSMRIRDLAEAIAPGLPVDESGIRPGEKLHETLISLDEGERTREVPWAPAYLIEPSAPSWCYAERREYLKTPAGFEYASQSNDRWLSPAELRELLA